MTAASWIILRCSPIQSHSTNWSSISRVIASAAVAATRSEARATSFFISGRPACGSSVIAPVSSTSTGCPVIGSTKASSLRRAIAPVGSGVGLIPQFLSSVGSRMSASLASAAFAFCRVTPTKTVERVGFASRTVTGYPCWTESIIEDAIREAASSMWYCARSCSTRLSHPVAARARIHLSRVAARVAPNICRRSSRTSCSASSASSSCFSSVWSSSMSCPLKVPAAP